MSIVLPCSHCGNKLIRQNWQVVGKNSRKNCFCDLKCRYNWQRINLTGSDNPFFGKHHTEKSKNKLRVKMLGRTPHNKGKRTPDHIRAKQRIARLVYYEAHPEAKEVVRRWATGRKQSPDTVAKRNAKNTGRKRTPEQVANITAKVPRGKDNHFWRGGTSAVSHRLRQCANMMRWRTSVFERDDYTCQSCGVRGGDLHPHHIIGFAILLHKLRKRYGIKNLYERGRKSRLLWNISNGQTLCADCHRKTDSYANNI